MTNYRRHRLKGGSYFFTVATANRGTDLLTARISQLRAAFRAVMAAHPFYLDAIVVLPDHLHCVWSLPGGDEDFPLRWRQIKAAFSRQIAQGEARSESRMKKGERGLWQRRYWEHALRDEADYWQHVDYIHFNPVKHGYVQCVANWPHSSFHRFVQDGVYPVNWGGEGVDQGMEVE